MKKIFAAAALASSMLVTAGPAFASKDEPMLPAEFEISTDSQPALDAAGNIVLDQDGIPEFTDTKTYSPKIHSAQVCLPDEKGDKYTIELQYYLVASAQDMGVDTNGVDDPGPAQDQAVQTVEQKMTPPLIDKAAAFIQEALNKSIGAHTMEEFTGTTSSEHLIEDVNRIFSDLAEGKRLDTDKPSFEEETGITITANSIQPVGTHKGCNP